MVKIEQKQRRDPDETCSQFVFGNHARYVDVEFRRIQSDPHWYSLKPQDVLIKGDIIFYLDVVFTPTHVGIVNDLGKVVSKFPGDPCVCEHDQAGNEVFKNRSIFYEFCIPFREKQTK